MKNSLIYVHLLFLLLSATAVVAQQESYDDVLLVVNDASPASQQIADYFASRRGIAPEHICHFSYTAAEVIDSLAFRNIQWQIQNFMRRNNLTDSINYIVTTKGCPLRVTTIQQDQFGLPAPVFAVYGGQASFEDLLSVINGPDSSLILATKGNISREWNAPFFNAQERFRRSAAMPIYLVTRLDGYTVEDVLALIRRAEAPASVGEGRYVFDKAPNWDYVIDGVFYEEPNNQHCSSVDSLMRTHGEASALSKEGGEYLRHIENVIGYASWGSNDGASGGGRSAIPANTWLNGAIAETFVSTSARSFAPGTGYGQSLIADWIAEGASGIKGYTDEPTTGSVANVQILFDRYRVRGWNLAESFYAASPYYVWRQVVVGDPKMRLSTLPPAISAPYSVDFGERKRFEQMSDTLWIHNRSGSPLQLWSIAPGGATKHALTIRSLRGTSFPQPLASGDSMGIVVQLILAEYGTARLDLRITYRREGMGDLFRDIHLQAEAPPPSLLVPPQLVLQIPHGASSTAATLTLKNESRFDSLVVTSISLRGAGAIWFSLDPMLALPYTIPVGESWNVEVRCANVGDTASALLEIESSARQTLQVIELHATTTSDLPETDVEMVEPLGIIAVAPNPFVSSTSIHYNSAERNSLARIELVDLHGAVVYSQSEPIRNSGAQTIRIADQRLVPGMYICRLKLEGGDRPSVAHCRVIVMP